jgi:hypothetical protein
MLSFYNYFNIINDCQQNPIFLTLYSERQLWVRNKEFEAHQNQNEGSVIHQKNNEGDEDGGGLKDETGCGKT